MPPAGFPHSEILGSQSGYRLPEAYRRFLRPSSVPGAKASTVCPYKLEPQRCSRPLCSSQNTGGPASISAPASHLTGASGSSVTRVLQPISRPEVGHSARALRTQQRVRRTHPPRRVPLPGPVKDHSACTSSRDVCVRQIIDVPPLSTC